MLLWKVVSKHLWEAIKTHLRCFLILSLDLCWMRFLRFLWEAFKFLREDFCFFLRNSASFSVFYMREDFSSFFSFMFLWKAFQDSVRCFQVSRKKPFRLFWIAFQASVRIVSIFCTKLIPKLLWEAFKDSARCFSRFCEKLIMVLIEKFKLLCFSRSFSSRGK